MQGTAVYLTASLGAYLTKFQWDMAKYTVKQSLKSIAEAVAKVVGCLKFSSAFQTD